MKRVSKKQTAKTNPANTQLNSVIQRLDAVMRRIPKGTFRQAGSTVGGMVAGPGGAATGRALGSGLATITGYGDYTIGPGIAAGSADPGVPQFTRHGNGIHVSHREYVGQVILPESSTFDPTHYTLNPGNSELFPWLANLAINFQEYKFKGLVFSFQSRTSEYAADNAMGTVMMATNYNVQEKPFVSSVGLLNTQFAVSSKPSTSFIHAIECDPKLTANPYRYVRDPSAQDTAVVSDPRFYDLGRTTVATEGIPGTPGYVVGALYVSYDVELITPVLNPSVTPDITTFDSTVSVSTLSGGAYNNETMGPQAIVQKSRYTCASLVPSTTTIYGRVPSMPSLNTSAFFPADLTDAIEFYLSGGYVSLKIKKTGTWRVVIRNKAAFSSGKEYLAAAAVSQVISGISAVGTLTASEDPANPFSVLTPQIVQSGGTPGTAYWDHAFAIVVGGVEGPSSYIDLPFGYFTSSSGGMLDQWDVSVELDWAKGVTALAESVAA